MVQRVVIVLVVLAALALPFVLAAVLESDGSGDAGVPPVRLQPARESGG